MFLLNTIISHPAFRVTFLVSSFVAVLIFGVVGLGQVGVGESCDVKAMFKWGQSWLDGENAYEYQEPNGRLVGQGYPPQTTLFFILFGFFSLESR